MARILDGPTRALRDGSRAALVDEIVGTYAGQPERWLRDSRDVMVALAPFHDAARRLRLDPADVLGEAAARLPAGFAPILTAFGGRDDVTPRAFGYALEEASDGPRYVSTLSA